MKKRMFIMLVSVATVFGAIYGFQVFKATMMKKWLSGNGLPPATVTAMAAHFEQWQPQITAVGTLRAVNGVDIISEKPGIIREIAFKSGDHVKAGQLLLRLDSEAELAKLAALKAATELATIIYQRDQAQFNEKTISQAQLDIALADLKGKKAQQLEQQAIVNKMEIRAPFDGTLGISRVSVGQFISSADKIVSLQATDPIVVDFGVPQRQIALLKAGQRVRLTTNSYEGREFSGRIRAINAAVDAATRNIQAEAVLANTDDALLPGMFANVMIERGAPEQLLTLPQTAINYNAYGATVFIARPPQAAAGDKALPVAEQVFVTTGATRGDQVAIIAGLQPGTQVITSGQVKLRNGTPLIIDNSVQPANDAAPTPQEH